MTATRDFFLVIKMTQNLIISKMFCQKLKTEICFMINIGECNTIETVTKGKQCETSITSPGGTKHET